MTDRQGTLDCVSADTPMSVNEIYNAVLGLDWGGSRTPTIAEVVRYLDEATKTGLLIHVLQEGVSHYRRRTPRELADHIAVRSGRQPEFL